MIIFASIVLTFCGGLFLLLISCKLLSIRFEKAGPTRQKIRLMFCRKLGWHCEPVEKGHDGCSAYGYCPVCKKHVLQDSQGNWF